MVTSSWTREVAGSNPADPTGSLGGSSVLSKTQPHHIGGNLQDVTDENLKLMWWGCVVNRYFADQPFGAPPKSQVLLPAEGGIRKDISVGVCSPQSTYKVITMNYRSITDMTHIGWRPTKDVTVCVWQIMSVVKKQSKRKKKHKLPRKRNTGRTSTILRRKHIRQQRLEENKYITINGKKILKPQWRWTPTKMYNMR